MGTFDPAYLSLSHSGELARRAEQAREHLAKCDLCAWECKVDRLAGKTGVCKTGKKAKVNSFGPHPGEEDPLRGWSGSGTIFFTRCNLLCQFCQNHEISQTEAGKEVTTEELAHIMLELQASGCHNINFVSPSHVVAQILAGLVIAAKDGLHIPLVYNTGGYDSLPALGLLDGVIDIYMPDMKYAHPLTALKYSKARDYPKCNQIAVEEMHRQVGDLQVDEHGIATRGLLVRHLILPNGLAGTKEIVRFLAGKISRDTYLNLMDQYRPCYNARLFPQLNRPITTREYEEAVQLAHAEGLYRLDHRTHPLLA
ncbi:MAG: 4Fe-4S cluster-binding domain-containing protein [Chloroflexi bacterium]|nr:4Fe-4S cluster-binding domain-containing protein [Chloroflexota bacterium]